MHITVCAQQNVQRQHDEQINNLLPSFLTIQVFRDVTLSLAGSSRPFERWKCLKALRQSVQEESLRNVGNQRHISEDRHLRQPRPPQDTHVVFITTVLQLLVRTFRHKFGELMPRCVMYCPSHVPRGWYKTVRLAPVPEPAARLHMCCLPAVLTASTSPANNFFPMFLEVQSHMCFTAWDDATGGEGLLMGSRRETGGKKTERGYVKRGAGGSLRRRQQQAASLLLPAVNKLHMW
jgi:hypothetical protein